GPPGRQHRPDRRRLRLRQPQQLFPAVPPLLRLLPPRVPGTETGVAPLSVSPPCGRLASSPEGGAKCTAVKPGERVVRQSRCAPLSRSPACGRLGRPPEGGAKCTTVKPGKRVVRQSRREVRLTTACPAPTGVLLAPPVGELSAKLTERATGRRSVIRSISAPRNVPNEITIYTYTTKTTKRLYSGRFVLFVGFVAFVI